MEDDVFSGSMTIAISLYLYIVPVAIKWFVLLELMHLRIDIILYFFVNQLNRSNPNASR